MLLAERHASHDRTGDRKGAGPCWDGASKEKEHLKGDAIFMKKAKNQPWKDETSLLRSFLSSFGMTACCEEPAKKTKPSDIIVVYLRDKNVK